MCFWIVPLGKIKASRLWIESGREEESKSLFCHFPKVTKTISPPMERLDCIRLKMDMSLSKLEDSEGQGSLECCSPRSLKVLDMISD